MLAILDIHAPWAVFAEPIFPEVMPGDAHTLEISMLLGMMLGVPPAVCGGAHHDWDMGVGGFVVVRHVLHLGYYMLAARLCCC